MDEIVDRFMSKMRILNEKDYMFNIITYGIAPTLCGFKSCTLITLSDKYKNTYKMWKNYKYEFLSKVTLSYFELNVTENLFLVLFYDAANLRDRLKRDENRDFLKALGYEEPDNIISSLYKLKDRCRVECPHEIGLFLDIPIGDVLGFIMNSGNSYMYSGYWKVYSDKQKAIEIFEKYNWSKKKVMELIGEEKEAFEIIRILTHMRECN
jgi:hypothetical protein